MVLEKPLMYANKDVLKKNAEIGDRAKNMLDRMNSVECFNKAETMMKNAFQKMTEHDNENAYIYYYRVLEICGFMKNKADFKNSFTKGLYARSFLSMYKDALDKLEKLSALLDNAYEKKLKNEMTANISQPTTNNVKKTVKQQPSVSDYQNKKIIWPSELVRALEKGSENQSKSALIIDYRDKRSHEIKYSKSNCIDVIQIPSELVTPGLIFNSLRSQLPVNLRSSICQLPKYDLVVLMDHKSSPKSEDGDVVLDTKANIIFEALFTYNNSSTPKFPPLILYGGFEFWQTSYPMYCKPVDREMAAEDALDPQEKYQKLIKNNYGVDYEFAVPPRTDEESPHEIGPQTNGAVSYPSLPPQSHPKPPHSPTHGTSSTSDTSTAQSFSSNSSSETNLGDQASAVIFQKPSDAAQNDRLYGPFPPHPQIPPMSASSAKVPQRPPIPQIDRTKKPDVDEFPQVLGGDRRTNGAPSVPPSVQHIPQAPRLDRTTKPSFTDDRSENRDVVQRVYADVEQSLGEHRVAGGAPGATGLYNMGNTCFMNATLQCLFQTPFLHAVFNKNSYMKKVNFQNKMGTSGIMAAVFSALLDAVWSGNYKAIRPAMFRQIFATQVNSSLADGQQHDAQEFQLFLLDSLHEDTNKVTRRQPFEQNYEGGANILENGRDYERRSKLFSASPVNDIFNLQTVSELRCLACGKTSATFEEASLVSLELPQYAEKTTLANCLSSHFSKTRLDDDSRWNCPSCRRPQTAEKTTKLWHLPPVLVIHLKRFSITNGDYSKNAMPVDFDASSLSVSPFVHERSQDSRVDYTLYAVTNHRGRLNSGHYTAVAKHRKLNKWLRFDDETVRENSSQLDTSDAFILYYKKRDIQEG